MLQPILGQQVVSEEGCDHACWVWNARYVAVGRDAPIMLLARECNSTFPCLDVAEDQIAGLYPDRFLPCCFSPIKIRLEEQTLAKGSRTDLAVTRVDVQRHRAGNVRGDLRHRKHRSTSDGITEAQRQQMLSIALGGIQMRIEPPRFLRQRIQSGDKSLLLD